MIHQPAMRLSSIFLRSYPPSLDSILIRLTQLSLVFIDRSHWIIYSSLLLLLLSNVYHHDYHQPIDRPSWSTIVHRPLSTIYCLLELIFHLVFIHRYRSLHRTDPTIIPHPPPSSHLRRDILDGILASFQSTTELRSHLTLWFYHSHPSTPTSISPSLSSDPVHLNSIHLDNAADLLAFMLFSSDLDSLDPAARSKIDDDLIRLQSAIQHTFPPGKNPLIRCMKHSLEPIKAQHRPLFFYLIIKAIRSFIDLIFFLVGFRRFHLPINGTHFTYWFHPGYPRSPSSKLNHPNPPPPIILVAGIVGLISIPHYAIYLLWTSERPIFLVGNSSVSLTITKPDFDLVQVSYPPTQNSKSSLSEPVRMFRRKILTLSEQSKCLKSMLKIHGFSTQVQITPSGESMGGAFLIGHSLGTTVTSYFVRNFRESVVGTLSIDPISIMPYVAHLVRTFVYAEPKTIGEYLVRLIAREIGVATVIQRHFHWHEFVMFTHLDQRRERSSVALLSPPPTRGSKGRLTQRRKIDHHFILSEDDAIVCYRSVSKYLINHITQLDQPNCSVTTLTSTPHAGFLLFQLSQVVKLTLEFLDRPPQDHPTPSPLNMQAPTDLHSSSISISSPHRRRLPSSVFVHRQLVHHPSQPPSYPHQPFDFLVRPTSKLECLSYKPLIIPPRRRGRDIENHRLYTLNDTTTTFHPPHSKSLT